MQPDEKFEAKLAIGRRAERAVARWIMGKGGLILPVYDYSGADEKKAPKLEAFSTTDSLVTPDLLVARKGLLSWVEVKWKQRADEYRKAKSIDTGISRRLWSQHQHVRTATGAKVWICFAHQQENVLTCDEIETLQQLQYPGQKEPGPRLYAGPHMGYYGMVFWPLAKLRPIAKYTELPFEAK